jgi:hypothetical protein
MTKIQIYCDSGADISKLKYISTQWKFYQFPYDSPDSPKKPLILAKPSEAQWRDCHLAWLELSDYTWSDFSGSPFYPQIEAIIGTGPEHRRDILHFDSAYKTECQIFLTSDKGHIWSKREVLELLTGIRTFYTPLEVKEDFVYLESLIPNSA